MANKKEDVTNKTGYVFSNAALMEQAFIRKSYSQEKGGQNNEILEFVGDKVLDLAVIILLMKQFGKMVNEQTYDGKSHNYFRTTLNEGAFTEIKKDMVEKDALSRAMDRLGLHEYLLMSHGDVKSHASNRKSVKEDLFEALLGAMAIDCNFDMSRLTEAVAKMINYNGVFNPEENTQNKPEPTPKKEKKQAKIAQKDISTPEPTPISEPVKKPETKPLVKQDNTTLLKEWCEKKHYRIPHFTYTADADKGWKCACRIKEMNIIEEAFGANKPEARKNASGAVYHIILEMEEKEKNKKKTNRFVEAVGELTEARILSQYNELCQKEVIKKYKFTYKSIQNPAGGTPIWECTLDDPERKGKAVEKDASKNKAKSRALLNYLNYLISKE